MPSGKNRAERLKDKNANKPWVSNYPELAEWLEAHEARCYNQVLFSGTQDEPRAYLEMYHIPGSSTPFIVEVRSELMGWEIYTPAGYPGVVKTLVDASTRLGVDTTVGLPKPTVDNT